MLIAGILLQWAVSSYREQMRQQAVHGAALLLKQNAAFLAEYYAQHRRYKQTASSWPALPYPAYPISGAVLFSIEFGSGARNTDNGYYVLRAVDVTNRLRYVELTQTGVLKYCQPAGSVEVCKLQP
ncbi:type IV pilin protein [Vogesella oryzae]|uniref:type IV pilin protein n=1 Tax=Vogesella oryzae TaxID=1735285 RepID=UPI0015821100|nr:hypothetical protein [Vogesella oryzae]